MDSNYILLKEDVNPDYEPTSEEIQEEAKYLGIRPEDSDLLWIAKEALRAPLPRHWLPYQNRDTGAIVYYNSKTGEVSEDHPMDEYFKSLYLKMKTDPISTRRAASNSFIPEEEQSHSPVSPRNQQTSRFSFVSNVTLKPNLYLTSLNTYNSEEAKQLCKKTHQAAVDVNLYKEWLKDSIKTMNVSIKKVEFLENKMKHYLDTSPFTAPS